MGRSEFADALQKHAPKIKFQVDPSLTEPREIIHAFYQNIVREDNENGLTEGPDLAFDEVFEDLRKEPVSPRTSSQRQWLEKDGRIDVKELPQAIDVFNVVLTTDQVEI